MLLYVKNTTGNIFKDLNDQQNYVLVTGRWFRAPGLRGPVAVHRRGRSLPPDFARIPDDSPKENVEGLRARHRRRPTKPLIANEIPQTATVDRAKATLHAELISGSPDIRPIPDTPLSYVFNSPSPIIMVSPTEWYAVQSGVWFTVDRRPSARGWWRPRCLPSSIPSPSSSPLHYVTYVQVYSATPQYVVVGYTPGYLGTVVSPGGVVVYGTGYYYASYVGTAIWYPPPVTYGYAANPSLDAVDGLGHGLRHGHGLRRGHRRFVELLLGLLSRALLGRHALPSYATTALRRRVLGSARRRRGVGAGRLGRDLRERLPSMGSDGRRHAHLRRLQRVDRQRVEHARSATPTTPMTGRASAGERGAVQNVYTGNYAYGGRGATYNPNTGVTARGGTATYGNAYSGSQNTARWGQVSGPGGQSGGYASVNGNHYADRDGNVYRNTGSGWQSYNNGSWNNLSMMPIAPSRSMPSRTAAGREISAPPDPRGARAAGAADSTGAAKASAAAGAAAAADGIAAGPAGAEAERHGRGEAAASVEDSAGPGGGGGRR